jgi:hypothetical protein
MLKIIKIAISLFSLMTVLQVYGKSGFTLPPTTIKIPIQIPLQLQMTTSQSRYQIGEYLSLEIQSNKDCYLNIIDIGTSGKTHVLFPNAYQQNNFLQANTRLKIPNSRFEIKIGAPSGEETLWAVCRIDDQALLKQKLDFDQHTFYPLQDINHIEQLPYVNADYSPEREARSKIILSILD